MQPFELHIRAGAERCSRSAALELDIGGSAAVFLDDLLFPLVVLVLRGQIGDSGRKANCIEGEIANDHILGRHPR